MWSFDLRQPAGEFWRSTPRRFRALQKRRMRERAEDLAVIAQSRGAKATPDDFMPKKATGMGPEVFHRFKEAFEDGA